MGEDENKGQWVDKSVEARKEQNALLTKLIETMDKRNAQ